jgi:hypothetical protein
MNTVFIAADLQIMRPERLTAGTKWRTEGCAAHICRYAFEWRLMKAERSPTVTTARSVEMQYTNGSQRRGRPDISTLCK